MNNYGSYNMTLCIIIFSIRETDHPTNFRKKPDKFQICIFLYFEGVHPFASMNFLRK